MDVVTVTFALAAPIAKGLASGIYEAGNLRGDRGCARAIPPKRLASGECHDLVL